MHHANSMLNVFSRAKVRISENNTKQKNVFLVLLSNESTFGLAKGTNKWANNQINLAFFERECFSYWGAM